MAIGSLRIQEMENTEDNEMDVEANEINSTNWVDIDEETSFSFKEKKNEIMDDYVSTEGEKEEVYDNDGEHGTVFHMTNLFEEESPQHDGSTEQGRPHQDGQTELLEEGNILTDQRIHGLEITSSNFSNKFPPFLSSSHSQEKALVPYVPSAPKSPSSGGRNTTPLKCEYSLFTPEAMVDFERSGQRSDVPSFRQLFLNNTQSI